MAIGEKLRKARMAKGMTTSEVAAATHMKVQTVEALERDDYTKIAAPIYAKGFIKLCAEHLGLDPQPLIDEYLERHAQPKDKARPTLSVRQDARPPAARPAAKAVEKPREKPAAAQPPRAAPSAPPSVVSQALFAEPSPPARQPPERRSEEEERAVDAPPSEPAGDLDSGRPSGSAARGVDALAKGTASLVIGSKEVVEDRYQSVRDFWRGHALDLSWFRFSGSPLKIVSVVIGIIVVLIFLLSSLSRCVRKPTGHLTGVTGKQSDELLLAADPPDVYVD